MAARRAPRAGGAGGAPAGAAAAGAIGRGLLGGCSGFYSARGPGGAGSQRTGGRGEGALGDGVADGKGGRLRAMAFAAPGSASISTRAAHRILTRGARRAARHTNGGDQRPSVRLTGSTLLPHACDPFAAVSFPAQMGGSPPSPPGYIGLPGAARSHTPAAFDAHTLHTRTPLLALRLPALRQASPPP
jgi:hypothetical protein